MSKFNFGGLLSIVANLGVIAGLVFLAYEIQQSNRLAIATTELDVRNSYASLTQAIYSDVEIATLMTKAANPDTAWSEVEQVRMSSLMRHFGNTWLSVDTACANGMASPATCKGLDETIREFLSDFPGTWPFWRKMTAEQPAVRDTTVGRIVLEVVGD
jgi:hypothetical protein